MIRSFKCTETERTWRGEFSRRLPQDIQGIALRKSRHLNNATDLNDLRSPPGNRLEMLKGNHAGQQYIRVNDQWRICFRWHDGNAYDVEITDYH